MPIGTEPVPGRGVHVRVWAPRCRELRVVLEGGPGASDEPVEIPLVPEENGYFSGWIHTAAAGTLYRFRLNGEEQLIPDPASRFQPHGPHGPSRVEDPSRFPWTDSAWRGVELRGQVIYEMHVGTFTPEGTWQAAIAQLPELAALGITVIELMPLAEFPGEFGWGYDGVDLFAPYHLYGEPDDVRRFVDRAHNLGMGVILDVVYNHLGPEGNYLSLFSEDYFSREHQTDWGTAINFDGENSKPVREFYIANACYWIDEFHFDGLRLDATQDMYDRSSEHIIAELTRRARQVAASAGRCIVMVAENEPQHARLVCPVARGGFGLDAVWNDDYHHSAMVALTGHSEAYYVDYRGTPQELISAMKWGYLYQGQYYVWQNKPRGTPALDLEPAHFVIFLQNHDQIANSCRGVRVHQLTSPGSYRAMMALTLLGPGTPMLFQGQEFAASTPFCYFADHRGELGAKVREGRGQFLGQFPSLASPQVQECLPAPGDRATFEACKLDPSERFRHAEAYALTRDLLALRQRDTVFRAQRRGGVEGAVLGPEALVLRFFADCEPEVEPESLAEGSGDRLLLVNLGRDLILEPAPEPLVAPPQGMRWQIIWSSEDLRYGGNGIPPLDAPGAAEDPNRPPIYMGWRIPGHAAMVLAPAAHEIKEKSNRG